MKHIHLFLLIFGFFSLSQAGAESPVNGVTPSPNGIEMPEGYRDWRVISASHRIDNNTFRVILGNDVAINAARSGQTHPWPDGAILAKLVWKQSAAEHWPQAIVPGEFVHAEFMLKDHAKYRNGTGWGWARWKGLEHKPYGEDANVARECITCHTPVQSRDWVFTTPAVIP